MTQDPALLSDREMAAATQLAWFYDLGLHVVALLEIVYDQVEHREQDIAMMLAVAVQQGATAPEPFVQGLPRGEMAINPAVAHLFTALAAYAQAVQQAPDVPEATC